MRFTIRSDDGVEVALRTCRPGGSGDAFLVQSFGWHGTPAPRESPIARGGHDADMFPSSLTQGARTVSLYGHAPFGSSVEATGFARMIAGLVTKRVTVTCEDAGGSLSCDGYVSDDPNPTFYADGKSVGFTLTITCPDPKKYGDEVAFTTSNGLCRVENVGNAPTFPKVHVNGPVTNLKCSLGGQMVKWSGLAAELDIDFRDMIPSSGTIMVDNAFEIPPGVHVVAVTCDGDVSVSVRPAWR